MFLMPFFYYRVNCISMIQSVRWDLSIGKSLSRANKKKLIFCQTSVPSKFYCMSVFIALVGTSFIASDYQCSIASSIPGSAITNGYQIRRRRPPPPTPHHHHHHHHLLTRIRPILIGAQTCDSPHTAVTKTANKVRCCVSQCRRMCLFFASIV